MLESVGAVLGVAVGLGLTFLAVSLLVTAVVELINSMFALRALNLRDGIRKLFDDPDFTGLAKQLYEHPRITPLGRTQNDPNFTVPVNLPSQIDRAQFAKALLDVTGLSAALRATVLGSETVSALDEAIATISAVRMRQLLRGVADRTAGDVKQIESEIAAWFDVAIDRVKVRFETRNLLLKLCFAFLVAVLLNVNAIRVVSGLWEQMSDVGAHAPPTAPQPGPADPAITRYEDEARAKAIRLTELETRLPIGWAPNRFLEVADNRGVWSPLWDQPFALLWSLVGWLITTVMAVLGAPFWADTFEKLVGAKLPLFGSYKVPEGAGTGD